MPGASARDFDEQYLGIKVGDPSPVPPPVLTPLARWGWRLRALPAMAWSLLSVGVRVRRDRTRIAQARLRLLEGLEHADAATLRWRMHEAEELGYMGSITNMEIVYMCGASHAILGLLCSELPPPPGLDSQHAADPSGGAQRTAWVAALTTGLASIDSAQVALDMAAVAGEVEAEAGLRELFASSPEEVAGELALGGHPEFSARLYELVERHGHRCLAEQDLTSLNWSMDPSQPIRRIQETLRSGLDQAAILPRQQEQRERAEQAAPTHLRGRRRWLFSRVLAADRRLLELRERQKGDLIWAIDVFRRLVMALGARLTAEGVLDRATDVHYLSVEELYGEPDPDWRERIARRRKACRALHTVQPPEVIHLRPELPPPSAPEPAKRELSGIGGSPGVARGLARVVHDPLVEETQPGEVLIAETTDVGWVPLFLNAAAVVCDIGGDLSHTVICARELGIPCVVNTKRAMATFRTGELLEVDGFLGTVRRLDSAGG
jgi:pyruvate,water dikinase